ncbi:MAG: cell division protein FtsQ/DivIB [bacterium]
MRDMGPKNRRQREKTTKNWSESLPTLNPGMHWVVRAAYLGLVLAVIFLGHNFYSYAISSERFEVELKIKGLEAVEFETVQQILEDEAGTAGEEGINLFKVSPLEIKQKISSEIKRFKSVDVRREFPDRFIIEVEERKPEAIAWVRRSDAGDGEGKLIDREGVLFAPTSAEFDQLKEVLPKVVGLEEARNQKEFQQIWQRVLAVKEAVTEYFSVDIIDLIKVMPAGYSVEVKINRPRELEVLLGSDRYELKVGRLYELMNTAEFRQMGDYIDLSDPDRIYTGDSSSKLTIDAGNEFLIG